MERVAGAMFHVKQNGNTARACLPLTHTCRARRGKQAAN